MITKFQTPAGTLEYQGKSGNLQYKRTGTGNIIASVDDKNWYPIPDKKGAENYWKLNGELGGINPYEEAKKLGLTLSSNDSAYIAGQLRYGNGQSTLSENQRDQYRRTMLANYFNNVATNKKGGTIKIKKKNKGKFTESAKRAGKSVQEHARDVVNDPKATKLQKKRAQFALNAKKFKHQNGGCINYLNLF